MQLSTRIREYFIKATGYWIYRNKKLPVGSDFFSDMEHKINFPLETVFDVGANVGQTALKFNRKFSRSKIYSFEPISNTFSILKKNTIQEKRISCYNLALGDKAGSVEINVFEGKDSVLNSLNEQAMSKDSSLKETIEVSTGDIFCETNNIEAIDLLKIDTEGYEIQVLEGFSRLINASKVKAIYCEVGFSLENKRNTYINALFDFASKNRFQFYGIYDIYNNRLREKKNFGNILFISEDALKDHF